MNPPLDRAEILDTPEAHSDTNHGPLKPLTIWRPSQFLQWTEPPGNHLVLPTYVTKGELTTIIGQGGIGKSRLFGLWLPLCQITGRLFCGLETGGDAQKWLVLCDENSIARIKEDLTYILPNFSNAEREKIEELLRVQAIIDIFDTDLNLGDPEVKARVHLTITQEAPGGIVLDPLVNFAPGDISKPGEMKEAIRLLASTVRRAAPTAANVLLHHARTGRLNIAQGVGYDAGNFGSGGKALFAAARCQINLMPGSADDDTRLVMSCAKANNCKKFETRGLIFDPLKFTYTVDPDFDPDAWLADVEGRARSGNCLCTLADVVAAVQEGYVATKDLSAHIQEAFATSKRSAERLISKAVRYEGIKQLARGRYTTGRKAEKFLNPEGCK